MIWDAIIFRNELDCLAVRLRELRGLVDRIILVEGDRTFQGDPKALTFGKCRHYFAKWPITHVVVDDWPEPQDSWGWEAHQRNAIARGLEGADQDDLVLISDADEIPSAAGVRDAAAEVNGGQLSFRHSMRMYWANLKATKLDHTGTQLVRADKVWSMGAEAIRGARNGVGAVNDGWHFCNLGDAAFLAEKLRSYAHVEHRRYADDQDFLRDCIRRRAPIDGSDLGFVIDNDDLPRCLRQKQFSHLLAEGN